MLKAQRVGVTDYFDVAGFPGRSLGLEDRKVGAPDRRIAEPARSSRGNSYRLRERSRSRGHPAARADQPPVDPEQAAHPYCTQLASLLPRVCPVH